MAPPIPVGENEIKVIKIFDVNLLNGNEDLQSKVDDLLNVKPVIPIFPKPIACIPGKNRPYLVPEYVGKAECGIEQAKQGMQIAADSYSASCKNPQQSEKFDTSKLSSEKLAELIRTGHVVVEGLSNIETTTTKTPIKFKAHPLFKFEPAKCHDEQRSQGSAVHSPVVAIPILLKRFDLIHPPHPFFDIVYRLNIDQLHDFRSAKVFLEVADKLKDELVRAKQRTFHLTYPASGSHMAPLAVPLKLMDQQVIDRANLVFTELDQNSVGRIEAYLKGSSELFENLKTDLRIYEKEKLIKNDKNLKINLMDLLNQKFPFSKKGEYEVTFSFTYRNKPISLTVAIRRSEGYSREEYLAQANLVVVHDLGSESDTEELINLTTKLRKQGKNNQPAWYIMEGDQKNPNKVNIQGVQYPVQSWKGLYGCGSIEAPDYFHPEIRTVKQSGTSYQLVKQQRNWSDPFFTLSNPDEKIQLNPLVRTQSSGRLKIHRKQMFQSVSLLRLP